MPRTDANATGIHQAGPPHASGDREPATESLPVQELCAKWIPQGLIGHIHVNDRNLRAPGQGTDRFLPLFEALRRLEYDGVVGVEPFDYFPDGLTAAARAIGYLRGIEEGLETGATSTRETR